MFNFSDKKNRKTLSAIIVIILVAAMVLVPVISGLLTFAG